MYPADRIYFMRRNLANGVGPPQFTKEFLDDLESFYDLGLNTPSQVTCALESERPMPMVKERALQYLDDIIALATKFRAQVDGVEAREWDPAKIWKA